MKNLKSSRTYFFNYIIYQFFTKTNNMKKGIITTAIMILIASISYGQKLQKGSIEFSDGTVKNGLVEVPKSYTAKNISFKQNEGAEKEEFDTEKIDNLHVFSNTGQKYVFENRFTKKPNGKFVKKKYLLLRVQEGYANLYFAGGNYKTDKDGNVFNNYSYYSGKDLPTFIYFIKKKDEDFFNVLGWTSPSPTMFGLNKMLKKNSAELLSEDPDLVQKIQDGEYKHEDIPEVVEIYNKTMANK